MTKADSDAFQTIQKIGLSPVEQQYFLPVSRGEGFYGLGWGNPNTDTIRLSEQFGIDPRAGVGSNNWGAEQGVGSAGSFPHVDHHRDGSPYVAQFKKYRTPEEGAAGAAKILLKPNLREALATGIYKGVIYTDPGLQQFNHPELEGKRLTPLEAAVYTQHNNRYFELDPKKYLAAVKRNYDILTTALKWPALLQLKETIAAVPLAPFSGLPLSEQSPTSSGGLSKLLKFGSEGEEVKALQTLLNRHGYFLIVDGKFGNLTEHVVRDFQLTEHLKVDGIVGPVTWSRLNG